MLTLRYDAVSQCIVCNSDRSEYFRVPDEYYPVVASELDRLKVLGTLNGLGTLTLPESREQTKESIEVTSLLARIALIMGLYKTCRTILSINPIFDETGNIVSTERMLDAIGASCFIGVK